MDVYHQDLAHYPEQAHIRTSRVLFETTARKVDGIPVSSVETTVYEMSLLG